MTTITYAGKYQDDYNRLMNLVPSCCKGKKGKGRTTRSKTAEDNDKVESVAAEIMTAVHKLNDAFYTNGTLTGLHDAFNFLSLTGMFDQDEHNTLTILSPFVKGEKEYDGTKEGGDDGIQFVVERVNDLAIEFLLKYPDMEWWIDRSFSMESLQKKGIDFISLAIAKQTTMKSSPPSSQEAGQVPMQDIQTPRVANVEYVI